MLFSDFHALRFEKLFDRFALLYIQLNIVDWFLCCIEPILQIDVVSCLIHVFECVEYIVLVVVSFVFPLCCFLYPGFSLRN